MLLNGLFVTDTSLKTFLRCLNPMRCLLCDAQTASDNLCSLCDQDLPLLTSTCSLCARDIGTSLRLNKQLICGPCILQPPTWSQLVCALDYCSPVNQLIHQFKFEGQLPIARLLARKLSDQVAIQIPVLPDLLLPVPLHWRRQWWRGFNQSQELALQIAKRLSLQISVSTCRRIRHTPAQSTLSHARRRVNVRQAFSVHKDVAGKSVAIVDDVFTSGATASALTSQLLHAGARQVQVWVCARVRPKAGKRL